MKKLPAGTEDKGENRMHQQLKQRAGQARRAGMPVKQEQEEGRGLEAPLFIVIAAKAKIKDI